MNVVKWYVRSDVILLIVSISPATLCGCCVSTFAVQCSALFTFDTFQKKMMKKEGKAVGSATTMGAASSSSFTKAQSTGDSNTIKLIGFSLAFGSSQLIQNATLTLSCGRR